MVFIHTKLILAISVAGWNIHIYTTDMNESRTLSTTHHHSFSVCVHVFVSKYNFNDDFEKKSFIWYNTKKMIYYPAAFFYCQATIFLLSNSFRLLSFRLYLSISLSLWFHYHCYTWSLLIKPHIYILCVCVCARHVFSCSSHVLVAWMLELNGAILIELERNGMKWKNDMLSSLYQLFGPYTAHTRNHYRPVSNTFQNDVQ